MNYVIRAVIRSFLGIRVGIPSTTGTLSVLMRYGSNASVALKILGVASTIGSVWIYWGYSLHLKCMANANAYERELARRVGWDPSELHAFSPHAMDGSNAVDDAAIFERIERSGGPPGR